MDGGPNFGGSQAWLSTSGSTCFKSLHIQETHHGCPYLISLQPGAAHQRHQIRVDGGPNFGGSQAWLSISDSTCFKSLHIQETHHGCPYLISLQPGAAHQRHQIRVDGGPDFGGSQAWLSTCLKSPQILRLQETHQGCPYLISLQPGAAHQRHQNRVEGGPYVGGSQAWQSS